MTAPSTWKGLVRAFYPDATDAECETILRELGAFPLVPDKEVQELLRRERSQAQYNEELRAEIERRMPW